MSVSRQQLQTPRIALAPLTVAQLNKVQQTQTLEQEPETLLVPTPLKLGAVCSPVMLQRDRLITLRQQLQPQT